MLRTLRTAVSIGCLVLCGCSVVMWMRSYKQSDDAVFHSQGRVGASSMLGLLNVYLFAIDDPIGIKFSSRPVSELSMKHLKAIEVDSMSYIRLPRIRRENALKTTVVLPYWFITSVLGVLAAAAGLRRPIRFDLIQALIATTIAAAVLAIGIAAGALD